MRVGFIGLGKLGLPCALAAARTHDVVGHDPDARIGMYLLTGRYPHREEGVEALIAEKRLRVFESIEAVVEHSEIVFLAIQTPHAPEFEGTTRLPAERRDFDYSYLQGAIGAVADAAAKLQKQIVVAVISTVLPGTFHWRLRKMGNEWLRFAYNPFFIAMGTCVRDYMNPEFVLIGVDDEEAARTVEKFYEELYGASPKQLRRMSVASAELCKVYYNVLLGLKIVAANTCMHIAHETGANADDVMGALMLATDRLISPKYYRPGMGDSGGCHPRDQIALSWLSKKIGLPYDLFGFMMKVREHQTEWLALEAQRKSFETGLSIVILGRAFKPKTNIETGSCAVLLYNMLREFSMRVEQYDPETGDTPVAEWYEPHVFVHATEHDVFKKMKLAVGSVVVDPWGTFPAQEGVELVRLGRH